MKVISGIYKGRVLEGFTIDGTRPTMDRVKESLFAMLQNYITGSVVLDLFSGSGNLGIEALSEGASFTPSPVIAAILFCTCNALTSLNFCSGVTLANTEYFNTISLQLFIIFCLSIQQQVQPKETEPGARFGLLHRIVLISIRIDTGKAARQAAPPFHSALCRP